MFYLPLRKKLSQKIIIKELVPSFLIDQKCNPTSCQVSRRYQFCAGLSCTVKVKSKISSVLMHMFHLASARSDNIS